MNDEKQEFPISPNMDLLRRQGEKIIALAKIDRIKNVYEGLIGTIGRVIPEQDYLYFLTDYVGQPIRGLSIPPTFKWNSDKFLNLLRRIKGVHCEKCSRCKRDLPVILTHSQNIYGKEKKTWMIFCPKCLRSRRIRKDWVQKYK